MVIESSLLKLFQKDVVRIRGRFWIPKSTCSCQLFWALAVYLPQWNTFGASALTQLSSSTNVSISLKDAEHGAFVQQLKWKVTVDNALLRCSVLQWHSFLNESFLTGLCHLTYNRFSHRKKESYHLLNRVSVEHIIGLYTNIGTSAIFLLFSLSLCVGVLCICI